MRLATPVCRERRYAWEDRTSLEVGRHRFLVDPEGHRQVAIDRSTELTAHMVVEAKQDYADLEVPRRGKDARTADVEIASRGPLSKSNDTRTGTASTGFQGPTNLFALPEGRKWWWEQRFQLGCGPRDRRSTRACSIVGDDGG